MSCQRYRQRASYFLDGYLSTTEREDFQRHLSQCPACAHFLEEMKETLAYLRTDLNPPKGLKERIINSLPDTNSGRTTSNKGFPLPRFGWRSVLWPAVALLLLLMVVFSFEKNVFQISLETPGENLTLSRGEVETQRAFSLEGRASDLAKKPSTIPREGEIKGEEKVISSDNRSFPWWGYLGGVILSLFLALGYIFRRFLARKG